MEKTALAKKTSYILVWYDFYDLRPENEAGPILTTLGPTQGLFFSGFFPHLPRLSLPVQRVGCQTCDGNAVGST